MKIPTQLKVPLNWAIDQHRNLPYIPTVHRDTAQIDTWVAMGYHRDSILCNIYQLPTPQPWFAYVSDYFPFLSEIRFAFHKFTPGHFLPTHADGFDFYKEQLSISDPDQIMRYIIFLEDWQEGHLLTIEDRVYTNWTAGDCVGWQGETLHAAINLGTTDRYTLQITGKLRA